VVDSAKQRGSKQQRLSGGELLEPEGAGRHRRKMSRLGHRVNVSMWSRASISSCHEGRVSLRRARYEDARRVAARQAGDGHGSHQELARN
jgi:hypothetical protein